MTGQASGPMSGGPMNVSAPDLRIAKSIRIVHALGADPEYVLEIDGQTFPFYVGVEGFTIGAISRNTMPQVTLTILAERVEAIHALPIVKDGAS